MVLIVFLEGRLGLWGIFVSGISVVCGLSFV